MKRKKAKRMKENLYIHILNDKEIEYAHAYAHNITDFSLKCVQSRMGRSAEIYSFVLSTTRILSFFFFALCFDAKFTFIFLFVCLLLFLFTPFWTTLEPDENRLRLKS